LDCKATRQMIGAYADGELDARGAYDVESHLRECTSCAAELKSVRATSALVREKAPRYKAPSDLRASVRDAIAPRRSFRVVQGLAFAACVLLAGYIGFIFGTRRGVSTETGFVAAHIQALMSNHLTDVLSSDQHTVKPWFNGKVDYSPPVTDLVASGFTLIGGRLDILDGKRVAVLVYGRRKHLIDVYVAPAGRLGNETARNGYNVVSFSAHSFDFRAVSDLNVDELRQFSDLLR